MSNQSQVKCTRCRNIHTQGERVEKRNHQFKGIVVHDLCCPRCGCRNFYDLSKLENAG